MTSHVSLTRLICILGSAWLISAQTAPPYCSFSVDSFSCQYNSMPTINRPIDYTQFSIPPQVLYVTVNGFMPYFGDTQTFSSTFNTFDKSQMDTNYPIELTIDCGRGGSLYLQAGAFYNMSHVQILKIRNCYVYNIPSYAFDGLTNLDSIFIESGTIDYVDPNSMVGLNVEKLTTDTHQPPQLFGHVGLSNAQFTSGIVPPGFLYSWKNLTSVRLQNANITAITADLFRYNTKIRYIDLSDNLFSALPSGLWTGLESLSQVTMYNIDWSCTCSELWFIDYARENNITLVGGMVCSTGDISATKYYYANCITTEICDGQTGFAMGNQCQTLLGVIISSVAGVALILNIVALTLTIMNLRIIPAQEKTRSRRENAKNKWKEAVKKAKKSKSKKQSNKVSDLLPEGAV